MRRSVLMALIAAAPVFSAGWALAQHQGHNLPQPGMKPPTDTRELVQFPPELVERTLANMLGAGILRHAVPSSTKLYSLLTPIMHD